MSEIAVIATELGIMSIEVFRNAVKQAVRAITSSLPEMDGQIDTSAVRLVAAETDFFIDAKPDFIKGSLALVEFNIDAKSSATGSTQGQKKASAVLKIEPDPAGKDRLLKTKSREAYEDEVISSLEAFISSKALSVTGYIDLTEVRMTYYVDGSFSIESGIPVEQPLIPSVQQEVVVDAPPLDAIFAGVNGV